MMGFEHVIQHCNDIKFSIIWIYLNRVLWELDIPRNLNWPPPSNPVHVNMCPTLRLSSSFRVNISRIKLKTRNNENILDMCRCNDLMTSVNWIFFMLLEIPSAKNKTKIRDLIYSKKKETYFNKKICENLSTSDITL